MVHKSTLNGSSGGGGGVSSINGDTTAAQTIVGSGGISVSTSSGVTTVSGGSSGGITWNEVTTATQALVVNNGYVMNNASQVIGTLPSVATQFSVIRIAGKGAGGWKIAQNAGQTIHFDGNNTTTGASGYLASQSTFDCIDLLCITANTDFLVTSSIGNITGV